MTYALYAHILLIVCYLIYT